MKQIWTGQIARAAASYGESTPMAAACCNACRTCVTTNLVSLGMAGVVAAGAGLTRLTRRLGKPSA